MEVEPSFDPGPSNAEDLNRGKYFLFTILIMLQLIVLTGGEVLKYKNLQIL